MGGGGLMQLVAYGMQDVYLTGNSQITFFKNLYRRHTNFSCEAVEQTFQSNSTSFGNKLVAVISRNGDLLHRLWLEVELMPTTKSAPTDTGEVDANTNAPITQESGACYVSKLGHALIKSAEVEIGGQRIDKIYGRFTHLWHKLSCKAEKEAGYELMTANDGPDGEDCQQESLGDHGFATRKLYIPINFFFSKGSAGAALPLIALQYHEVRVSIELASMAEVTRKWELKSNSSDAPTIKINDGTDIPRMASTPKLYSDFFYLDTDERRRFSQMSHEYLIEQLQFTGAELSNTLTATEGSSFSMRLNFNHPTKAVYWTTEGAEDNDTSLNPFYNGRAVAEPAIKTLLMAGTYGMTDSNNPIASAQLQLNGHERFSIRDGDYFNWCQPYQHHTRVPYDHWVGMYSFCLSPEEHQPSGALNFSRIDNATLKLDFKPAGTDNFKSGATSKQRAVYVYAVNYNVLRILSGMGGLAFSN